LFGESMHSTVPLLDHDTTREVRYGMDSVKVQGRSR
jgi:hypothetical protein